ncbi:MAG: GLPGLI family protein [Chitinophagaceae bacterium]|nr:GLPGLI family protein [Chitinophagaceae bacterium]
MKLLFTIFLAFTASMLQAQAPNTIFLSQGKIEFEKKLNQYAQLEGDNSWSELQKKSISQFKTTYFDMLFTRTKTLYKPGREGTGTSMGWFSELPAQENTVYSDLEQEKSVSQKKVFEQLFLVQDSIRKIRWKLTDETRTIAGFSCRRANAIIMDSIYVVAFYTDEILTTGGPESFNGLPGMILGVALPHQHVTWFATKVEAVSVTDAQLIPPQKGKKTDNAGLKETVNTALKDWGKYAQRLQQAVFL